MMTPHDMFTAEDLLILDTALNEFIWSLEDELDTWDAQNGDGFQKDDFEYNLIFDMLLDAENLSDEMQELLVEEMELEGVDHV